MDSITDYYIQDEMIDAAAASLEANNIEYHAPTKNTKKDDEPSLVVVPYTWGKERAVIAIDAFADNKDRAVIEVVGYIPAGVTKHIDTMTLLAIANEENLESDGLIFAVETADDGAEAKNVMSIRAVLHVENDTFPEDRFKEAYSQIYQIIGDYRAKAREDGNFPEQDPRRVARMPELPE